MERFDMDYYFRLLRMKGYEVTPKYDRQKELVGYTIGKNASVFKASAIGRKFMASRLEDTWKKLHPQPVQVKMRPVAATVTPSVKPVHPTVPPAKVQPVPQPKPEPAFITFEIKAPDGNRIVEIPNTVKYIFLYEARIPEDNDIATVENVAHVAMLLFVGYIHAATSMSESCGGGGGLLPPLIGARRMMRKNACMLAVVS